MCVCVCVCVFVQLARSHNCVWVLHHLCICMHHCATINSWSPPFAVVFFFFFDLFAGLLKKKQNYFFCGKKLLTYC